MIQQYFTDKLKDNTRKINSYKKDIVDKVQSMDIQDLNNMSISLQKQQKINEELVRDCIKYCSVEQVINVFDTKDYSGESLISFRKYDIEYAYKYDKKVTVEERELLIKRFGYSLKEAKII